MQPQMQQSDVDDANKWRCGVGLEEFGWPGNQVLKAVEEELVYE